MSVLLVCPQLEWPGSLEEVKSIHWGLWHWFQEGFFWLGFEGGSGAHESLDTASRGRLGLHGDGLLVSLKPREADWMC